MTDEPPVEPSKSTPAKKAPAKKAAAKSAPAKKAAAKTAPAKKAAAKKGPAKKAAAKKAAPVGTPRSTILNRIHELEERIAADAPIAATPRSRPARPQPAASTTPEVAPEAAEQPSPAPDEPRAEQAEAPLPPPVVKAPPAVKAAPAPRMPAEKPAKEPKPAKPAPAARPVVVVDEAAPVATEQRVKQPTRVVPVPIAEGSAVRGNRVLAALIVLLLAAAAGMGAAAAVKDRPSTWRSESVVKLNPASSPGPDAQSAVVTRLVKRAQTPGFAGLTAASAGVPASELREYAEARRDGADRLVVEVQARSANGATRLAESAGRQLLLTLATDQAVVSDPERRLTAAVTTPATEAVKEKPTDRQAWLAGGLAALAVLLVGLVIVLLMTSKPRR